jgi:predicted MFS family arabinose efflux permease
MIDVKSKARHEWRAGWPAVCAGLLGAGAAQIHFASIGVFIKPMTQALGWGSSTVTLGIFICSIVSVPGVPLVGLLAQKVGLSRIILLGLPLFFLAFASLGLLSHNRTEWVIGWAFVALASVLSKANLWMLWVAQRFDAARGMAFALIMVGAGVLAIFVPIMSQLSIESFGWRATFPLLAAAMALLSIPACVVGFRLCPPAAGERTKAPRDANLELPGMLIQEAIRTRSFWQISLIAFLIGAGLISLQIHLVPMFEDKGLGARTAAVAAGVFGGATLAGRFIVGGLLDRFSANLIGMINLLLPALACVVYLTIPIGSSSGMLVTVLLGFGAGAEGDVLGYITAKYFGVRSFGTIFGAMTGLFALGAGVGPYGMSLLRDHFGSYSGIVLMLFCALLVCSVLFVTLGSYPTFSKGEEFTRHPKSEQVPAPI